MGSARIHALSPNPYMGVCDYPLMEDRYAEELEVAIRAVEEATRTYAGETRGKETSKTTATGSYDIITGYDVAAQDVAMSIISEAFPEDSFICEEGDREKPVGSRIWVIDPIDGTMNFQRRIPVYGTQLSLMVDGETVLAAMRLPPLGETYATTRASGVTVNGRPVPTPTDRDLSKCIVTTGDFSRRSEEWRRKHYEIMGAMRDEVARIRMLGAACTDFAYIASRRADIHLRFVNKIWDFGPGLFMARVSGAYVDEDLLRDKRFLLLTQTREEAEAFKDRVLSRMEL